MQRDPGVACARFRVRDLDWIVLRVGRIRDVPALHRRHIDARHQQPRAVGRPPIPLLTPHLLCRDELGEPVCHVVVFRCRKHPRCTAVDADSPQSPALHERDRGAGGVELWVNGDAAGGDLRQRLGAEIDHIQPSSEVEHRAAQSEVSRVTHDAA